MDDTANHAAKAMRHLLENCAFNWKDLNGKNLDIHVGVDMANGHECTVVMGYEKKTGKFYILNENYEEVKKVIQQ